MSRQGKLPPTIWWVRRDLRMHDNPALATALESGGPVLPLFVSDDHLSASPAHRKAGKRIQFLHAGLRSLDAALRERGTRLVVRHGSPTEVVRTLVAETGAARVVAEEDYSPYARRRDARVASVVPLTLTPGVSVHHPSQLLTRNGDPYRVFTPFSRAWRARGLPSSADVLRAPGTIPDGTCGVASDPTPRNLLRVEFPADEQEARRRLRGFARSRRGPIRSYGDARDRVDLDGTSTLSPYLRFGMLSCREAVVTALEAGASRGAGGGTHGPDRWLTELIWREFYLAVLHHFPFVLRESFDPALRSIQWRRAPADLRAWRHGRTGYPMVDAAMRQLTMTGWVPNRARMIVASFLTKDLLIDWREGERWFMQHLVDGDPAANNGGWQWTAGTGTDAAPYFRVLNPTLQAKRCDPDGTYVRRWVPELQGVPAARIHEPWRLGSDEQRAAGVRIGIDYPRPLVDHAYGRARALAAYQTARDRRIRMRRACA